jgi:hypothetical protein
MLGYDVGDATYPLKIFDSDQAAKFEEELKQIGWPFN